jgi:hypothetical protein
MFVIFFSKNISINLPVHVLSRPGAEASVLEMHMDDVDEISIGFRLDFDGTLMEHEQ